MIKYIIIAVCVIGAGAMGYVGERFMRPTTSPPSDQAASQELMFKMPLGKFTMQIIQSRKILHLVFDMDVYVMGASSFHEINGAVGRARLRDATVSAIAELAETDLSLAQPIEEEARKAELAAQIVRKLYVNFPAVRTARLNSFYATTSLRN